MRNRCKYLQFFINGALLTFRTHFYHSDSQPDENDIYIPNAPQAESEKPPSLKLDGGLEGLDADLLATPPSLSARGRAGEESLPDEMSRDELGPLAESKVRTRRIRAVSRPGPPITATGRNWVSSVVFRRRLRQTGGDSILAKSTKFSRLCEKPSAAGCVQPAPAAPPGLLIGEMHACEDVKVQLHPGASRQVRVRLDGFSGGRVRALGRDECDRRDR